MKLKNVYLCVLAFVMSSNVAVAAQNDSLFGWQAKGAGVAPEAEVAAPETASEAAVAAEAPTAEVIEEETVAVGMSEADVVTEETPVGEVPAAEAIVEESEVTGAETITMDAGSEEVAVTQEVTAAETVTDAEPNENVENRGEPEVSAVTELKVGHDETGAGSEEKPGVIAAGAEDQ